jgi:hypothetical protein
MQLNLSHQLRRLHELMELFPKKNGTSQKDKGKGK